MYDALLEPGIDGVLASNFHYHTGKTQLLIAERDITHPFGIALTIADNHIHRLTSQYLDKFFNLASLES